MKNPFKREDISYNSGEPITPYQRAQQEWDMRIGSARAQAYHWRLVAFVALLTSLLLLTALLLVITLRRDHLYVAEVSKEGKVMQIAPVTVKYQPTEAQKSAFLAQFLELTRTIPLDPVLAKKNWLKAYRCLTTRAINQLNQYFRQNNPALLLGKKTVTLQIDDINHVTPTTLHASWTEITVDKQGQEESPKQYSGVFTIIIKQPTTVQAMYENPLGIYMVDFSIKQKNMDNQ